jgi:hypothetical protein
MNNEQMELGFTGKTNVNLNKRQQRLQRASWWFGRMRDVVDRAIDWNPSLPGRPEQIYLISRRS